MAVYGRDDPTLFERAIESILANSLRPDDFVLVVDGPVPATIEDVIDQHESDGVMRVLRLPANVGLATALNRGLGLIHTAWVVRADADDSNLPDRFQKQAQAVLQAQGEVDLLGGAIIEVDRHDAPLAVRAVPLSHAGIVRRLSKRNPFNHMTVAYRTALAREVGGYPDIHLKEDYALWTSMIARGARCANLSDVLVRATTGHDMYRRRGGLRYAKSECDLQLHLFKLGHKGLISAVLLGVGRSAVFLLPPVLRRWVYEHLLRRRPG